MSGIKRFRDSRFRTPGIAGDKNVTYGAADEPGALSKLYKNYQITKKYKEKYDKLKENYENVKGLLDKEERAVSILKLCEEWLPEALKFVLEHLSEEEVPIVDFFMKYYKPHFMILEDLIGADAKYQSLQELKAAAEEQLPSIKNQADAVIKAYDFKGTEWVETLRLIGEWNVGVKLLWWSVEGRQTNGLVRLWRNLGTINQKIQERTFALLGQVQTLRTVMDQVDDLVEKRKEKLDSLEKQSSIGFLMGKVAEQQDIYDEVKAGKNHLLQAHAAVAKLEKLADQWVEKIDSTMVRTLG